MRDGRVGSAGGQRHGVWVKLEDAHGRSKGATVGGGKAAVLGDVLEGEMSESVLPGPGALTRHGDSPWSGGLCCWGMGCCPQGVSQTRKEGEVRVLGAGGVSRAGMGRGLALQPPSPLRCDAP